LPHIILARLSYYLHIASYSCHFWSTSTNHSLWEVVSNWTCNLEPFTNKTLLQWIFSFKSSQSKLGTHIKTTKAPIRISTKTLVYIIYATLWWVLVFLNPRTRCKNIKIQLHILWAPWHALWIHNSFMIKYRACMGHHWIFL